MHLGFDEDRIGEGALLAPSGLEAIGADPEPPLMLVEYAEGVDPDEAYAALQEDWGNTVSDRSRRRRGAAPQRPVPAALVQRPAGGGGGHDARLRPRHHDPATAS